MTGRTRGLSAVVAVLVVASGCVSSGDAEPEPGAQDEVARGGGAPIWEATDLPGAAIGENQADHLFELSDGRHVVFLVDGASVVGRISSDGQDWSTSFTVAGIASDSGVAVAPLGGDEFVVGFEQADALGRWVTTTDVSVLAAGESDLVSVGQMVQVGSSPLATKLSLSAGGATAVVGWARKNPTTNKNDYITAVSTDGGATWGAEKVCRSDMSTGAVGVSSTGRAVCLASDASRVYAKELVGASWVSFPGSLVQNAAALPAAIAGDEFGNLHAAVGSGGDIVVLRLPDGASAWDPATTLGSGSRPVIGTGDKNVMVLAQRSDEVSWESVIAQWSSTDGGDSWVEGRPIGEVDPIHVYDYNDSWAFTNRSSDGLFVLRDETGTELGNQIGISKQSVRLDGSPDGIGFAFEAERGTANEVSVFVGSGTVRRVRVGIQTDDDGEPSGSWVGEVAAEGVAVAGAFADVDPTGSKPPHYVTAGFPAVELDVGERYHVVVAPTPDPTGSLFALSGSNWVDVGLVEGHDPAYPVAAHTGSGWSDLPGLAPRFKVRGSGGESGEMLIAPASSGPIPASSSSFPSQQVEAPNDMVVSEIDLYLDAGASPAPELMVLDSGEAVIAVLTTGAEDTGWATYDTGGLQLTDSNVYKLVLDASNGSSGWAWHQSGGSDDSWGGFRDYTVVANSLGGYVDRTAEAVDDVPTQPDDFVVFDTSTDDALYVGFPDVVDRLTIKADSGLPNPIVQYWDGAAWRTVTTIESTLTHAQPASTLWFTTSTPWEMHEENGTGAYWLRLTPATGSAQRQIERISGTRYFDQPAVTRDFAHEPLALWNSRSHPDGVVATNVHPLYSLASTEFFTREVFGPVWGQVVGGTFYDPGLQETTDDYRVQGSINGGWISKTASSGFSFITETDDDQLVPIVIQPVGVTDGGAVGTTSSDSVIFEDLHTDTDVVIRPGIAGIHTFHILRTRDAPTTLEWTVTSPPGATIDLDFRPGSAAVRDAAGGLLAELDAPWASDARGRLLESSIATPSANSLRLELGTPASQIDYPIVVDPEWRDRQLLRIGPHPLAVRGFIPEACLLFGRVCKSGAGTVRKECTAQAHAIRKLAIDHDLNVITSDNQWELGGKISKNVSQQSCSNTPVQSTSSCDENELFRVDGMYWTKNQRGDNLNIYEVKAYDNFPEALPQLQDYRSCLAGPFGYQVHYESHLTKIRWAVKVFYEEEGPDAKVLYAWAARMPYLAPDGSKMQNGLIWYKVRDRQDCDENDRNGKTKDECKEELQEDDIVKEVILGAKEDQETPLAYSVHEHPDGGRCLRCTIIPVPLVRVPA